ncbi:MAG TPA: CRISPR-associated endonuclease Cas2 [Anaerolineae bacterium]|nr:CRISPR-associated endonuclease Cas2 [Anaerolineae bacterium]HOR00081.1 CRISPR-associated endonuclease Cas2 [Anaerolineae bacterium]HPL29234.1 CRISPR-associated endonuclease Cas2 [Anaerolineae bacterium]
MRCLLVYDIESDRLRAKIADVCLDYGLKRIQLSSFFGELSRNRQEEIMQRISRTLGRNEGNVQLFPICEKDLALRRIIDRHPPEPKSLPEKS